MDSQKESMVLKGMNNVHSGLGILLGMGRINSNTHDQILALLNDDEGSITSGSTVAKANNSSSSAPRAQDSGKKLQQTSWGSEQADIDSSPSLIDLQHGVGNMSVNGRSHGPKKSISLNSPVTPHDNAWGNSGGDALSPARDASSEPRRSNIVCPWFLTPGYQCREQTKGQCAWIHKDVADGIKDPLICSFWAENNCVKPDDQCRFAHYWAQHRQIAPVPGSKYKKGSKKSVSDAAW